MRNGHLGSPSWRVFRAIIGTVAIVTLAVKASASAVPGRNGRIAVAAADGIHLVDPDGGDPVVLTATAAVAGQQPDWSADGTKLVFIGDPGDGSDQLFTIQADGTGLHQLTVSGMHSLPKWSPDGSRIVFVSYLTDLFVINADGSGVAPLTASGALIPGSTTATLLEATDPNWSPDGGTIVFTAFAFTPIGETCNLWTLHPTGGSWTQLTPTDVSRVSSGSCFPDTFPNWSPDGTRVVFDRLEPDPFEGSLHHIYMIRADGSGMTGPLTDPRDQDYYAAWSPDGTKIAFYHAPRIADHALGSPDVYVMNPDGSNPTRVTEGSFTEGLAAWQPLHTPKVTLKINGQHPASGLVATTGPLTLTLDMIPDASNAPLSWYWLLLVNGQAIWITSTGIQTTPGPLAITPAIAITNTTLLNVTLPPATTVVTVLFLADASSIVAGDAVGAARP